MTRFAKAGVVALLAAALPFMAQADEAMNLLAPVKTGGMPLMEALAARHADRGYDAEKALDLQTLSNLLWASWGINRSDGRRTAPSALNKQELNLYVNTPTGVWQYDAAGNRLVKVSNTQVGAPINDSPVVLIYAVPEKDPFGPVHAGLAAQNAGLYCASASLACVVKGSTAMRHRDLFTFLPEGWRPVVTFHAGYPKAK